MYKVNRQDEVLPDVSVIIATYNRKMWLGEALESVVNQSYRNIEIIIIDDGSTDDTKSLVMSFNDSRIHYFFQENRGRSAARNVGLQLARGKYIAFLDSDDVYFPEKLAVQLGYLDEHPETGMIYTSAYCINDKGEILSHKYEATISGHIYNKIAFFVPVTITLPTVMVRREIILALGGFDEQMHRFEDTDLWRRISKITRIDAMPEITCKLRTHVDNHLHAQDPQSISNAVHYYVHKILLEDQDRGSAVLNKGISGLYQYYGSALMSVPGWRLIGKELLEHSSQYASIDAISDLDNRIYSYAKCILSALKKRLMHSSPRAFSILRSKFRSLW
jgi:glycosyltransferase involved in cell wall biosynthesis